MREFNSFRRLAFSKNSIITRSSRSQKPCRRSSTGTVRIYKLTYLMQMRKVDDDEVIVKEGDPGSEFFIIQSGECHVYKQVLVDVTQCLIK
mmetsp:Transcript_11273/g.25584  ORF Transcript_11273/g.25584 Transcript_11273/m.25584 type:complete len:91 (+) Transcript_11273:779-1051(+)